MNKYQIGQTLYWFKYQGHQPDIQCFDVGCIKQTKDGYKYSTGQLASTFIREEILFSSIPGAVEHAISVLKGFLP